MLFSQCERFFTLAVKIQVCSCSMVESHRSAHMASAFEVGRIRLDQDTSGSKFRWIKRLLITALCCACVVFGGGWCLGQYAQPVQRTEVTHPIYTIGDPTYREALEQGKSIVKFGRIPLGIYPGGIAFDHPNDAWAHLRDAETNEGWGVYELSGDYLKDTLEIDGQNYTSVSLLVVRAVEQE